MRSVDQTDDRSGEGKRKGEGEGRAKREKKAKEGEILTSKAHHAYLTRNVAATIRWHETALRACPPGTKPPPPPPRKGKNRNEVEERRPAGVDQSRSQRRECRNCERRFRAVVIILGRTAVTSHHAATRWGRQNHSHSHSHAGTIPSPLVPRKLTSRHPLE